MLNNLGYIEDNKGKTSGSRVCFYNKESGHLIRLHKPHPANILKQYQIDLIFEELEGRKII
ncbi:MAG: type II toxin-antitoxin system HicA family toxin [Spirochaetaceae bacterium]|nr:type II toxin-antitoxin system HicA family toxin [Spirochaetaceae bacterium]